MNTKKKECVTFWFNSSLGGFVFSVSILWILFRVFFFKFELFPDMSLSKVLSMVWRNGLVKKPIGGWCGTVTARQFAIWEPDYLILAHTKTPEYDLINVQIKGYDFAVLEQYQRLIHRIAKQMKIKVNLSWASPQKDLEVHHFKPNSTEVQYKYNMKLRERNIQVIDVKSHVMALFIEAVLTTCPPGVSLSIHEHEEAIREDRYIPNFALLELEKELDNMEGKKN